MQTPGPLVAKCVHLAVAAPAVYPGTEAIVGDTTDSGRPLALRLILKPNAHGWAVCFRPRSDVASSRFISSPHVPHGEPNDHDR
jgi:hypothetical protein